MVHLITIYSVTIYSVQKKLADSERFYSARAKVGELDGFCALRSMCNWNIVGLLLPKLGIGAVGRNCSERYEYQTKYPCLNESLGCILRSMDIETLRCWTCPPSQIHLLFGVQPAC